MPTDLIAQQREADFHNKWASSTRVEDVLVRECFEAPTAMENQFILKRMGSLHGKKLLDIGAGLGESSVYFALKGARVTTVDVSPLMVETALAVGKKYGVELEGVVASAENLNVAKESYDFVYLANTIHHVQDRALLFEQMSAALKPGGMFFSYDPIAYNPVINMYRRMATAMRTPDEAPLTAADVKLARKYFLRVGHKEFWISSLLLFAKYYLKDNVHPNEDRYWKRILRESEDSLWWWKPFRAVDATLTRLPIVRWLAWNMVMWGEKASHSVPRHGARRQTKAVSWRAETPVEPESKEPLLSGFDAFAGSYPDLVNESIRVSGDSSDYFARYKAAYIARKTAPIEGKLLDYGCGVGLLSRHLKERFPLAQVDGFDPSEESLSQLDASLRSQGVFTSKSEELANAYATIVLANVLHHVNPVERQALIRQVKMRLAPGGRLVVFEHNPLNPLTRWAVSHCPFDEGVELLRPREVRVLCASVLLGPRTDYIVFFPRWLAWFRPLERFLGWCAAGAQHVTICRGESQLG